MAIAMVALLAFGGTYAYFTATSKKIDGVKVTTGVISVKVGERTEATINGAVTGTKVMDAVNVDASATTVKSYVFVTFDITLTAYEGATETLTPDMLFGTPADNDAEVKFDPNAGWAKLENVKVGENALNNVYYQVYNPTYDEGSKTYSDANYKASFFNSLTITASPEWKEGEKQPVEMGATLVINLSAEAIQAFKDYSGAEGAAADFATAADAYVALHTEATKVTA